MRWHLKPSYDSWWSFLGSGNNFVSSGNIFGMTKKLQKDLMKVHFFVEFVCPFALRKAIVRAFCQISVTPVCCWRHTVLNTTPDVDTIEEMFKFGGRFYTIGRSCDAFVTHCECIVLLIRSHVGIVWPSCVLPIRLLDKNHIFVSPSGAIL